MKFSLLSENKLTDWRFDYHYTSLMVIIRAMMVNYTSLMVIIPKIFRKIKNTAL
jgi:hypothetical protein